MKFRTLSAILFFLTAACTAEGDEYSPYLGITELDYLGVPNDSQGGNENRVPFFGGVDYEHIWNADFDEHHLKGEHLVYRVGKINLGSVCFYNKCYDEGIALGLTYTATYLRWNQNPYFRQRYFDTLSVNISGFSHRVDNWYWRGNVSMNFDVNNFDPGEYLTWDLLLWGRYSYTKNLGLHIGFYAITGMKIDRVYPILGFDWQCTEKLKFNVVFPMDINATYTINKCWTTGAAVRFFQSRQRANKHAHVSRALWFYNNWGAEYFVNYNLTDFIHINLHGGYSFGGTLKLANKHYMHARRLDFKGAPYIGGTLVLAY